MTDRDILERLLVTLTTCENGGDIAEAIWRAGELAGIEIGKYTTLDELGELWADKPGLWSD